MFKLFGKKNSFTPTVTQEDKDWVENSFLWLIENFGLERLNEQPFIIPNSENFAYTNLKDPNQFQQLFEQICGCWDLNPTDISIEIFDDIITKQWSTGIKSENAKSMIGVFERTNDANEKPFRIQLASSNLETPDLLIAVLAHELAHVKLLGGNYLNGTESDMEPLTDLTVMFFGFGIFVANTVESNDVRWMRRTGYLPNQIISYANALICYITEFNTDGIIPYLNLNTKALFQKDVDFLFNTRNTLLTGDMMAAYDKKFKITGEIEKAFEARDFDKAIDLSNILLHSNAKDTWAYCNIGYALLQKREYRRAIEFFNQVIDIDPYWDYPYNNRGYCKLQMGDLDNGAVDIFHAFEMNPQNSFALRNIGIYYLFIDDLEKSLESLLESERLDPKTDLINFYLSKLHSRMGDREKAKFYAEKSAELKEFNDSILE